MKIALDPNMYYNVMSTADTLFKARELGFNYVELSPNTNFHFWHHYPKADDEFIAGLNRAQKDSGVEIATLNPVFNWASPDEAERQAQVRNWKRLLEIADQLDVRDIVSEFSGDPNQPARSEQQWYRSMEELIPVFEKYEIRLAMEPHPYDFVELHDPAYDLVRSINKPWIGYEYCAPHTFHISDGEGDVARMIRDCAPKLFEVHIADAFNHKAGDGNRYIVNPPGVDARVHQHAEPGSGDVPFDVLFESLKEVNFDGVFSVCIFGFLDIADEANRRVLETLRTEFPDAH